MISEENKRLQVTIPFTMYDALDNYCTDYSFTKSELVKHIIDSYLAKEGYYIGGNYDGKNTEAV